LAASYRGAGLSAFKLFLWTSIALLCAGFAFQGIVFFGKLWERLSPCQGITSSNFGLYHIETNDLKRTTPQDLERALNLRRGSNLWRLDIYSLKKVIEALPWVASAQVRKRFPNTLILNVNEKDPVALYILPGTQKKHLVAQDGSIIATSPHQKDLNLLTLYGPQAPQHAIPLLKLLAQEPRLQSLIKGAQHYYSHRWDLFLKGWVRVKLPAGGSGRGLSRLAAFLKSMQFSLQGIQEIDCRLPDRTIVRYINGKRPGQFALSPSFSRHRTQLQPPQKSHPQQGGNS
jgi:cell division protein FtsQ